MEGSPEVEEQAGTSQWVNVQDPVKQMISAISKAIRTQSAGIRDLDRKVASAVTTDQLEKQVSDLLSLCCSKQVRCHVIQHARVTSCCVRTLRRSPQQ
jgi:hypothetical protein